MRPAKIFYITILFLFFSALSFAQESDSTTVEKPKAAREMTMDRAKLLVPRPAFEPVRSLIPGEEAAAGDTVATTDPKIQLVLYPNGTWKYVKDADVVSNSEVYKEYWATDNIWPYNVPVTELPYAITLVLSDDASGFCFPYHIKVISPYGKRRGRNHSGVDIPMPHGSKIYAAFDGKVRVSTYHKGYGNVVIIRHENGLETWYAHLSERKVLPNQWVKAGDLIGLCGSTGRSTGPHLHFETRYLGYSFDPQWIIDCEKGVLRHGVYTIKRTQFGTENKYIPDTEAEEDELYKTVEEIMNAEKQKQEQKAAAEAAKKAEVWHTVRSGENLSIIAKKYGTTVNKICSLNKISSKTPLKVGKRLRVK